MHRVDKETHNPTTYTVFEVDSSSEEPNEKADQNPILKPKVFEPVFSQIKEIEGDEQVHKHVVGIEEISSDNG